MSEEKEKLLPCPFCMAKLGAFGQDLDESKRVVDTYIHPSNGCPLSSLVFRAGPWNTRASSGEKGEE